MRHTELYECWGNFFDFLAIFGDFLVFSSGQIRFRTRMARSPVGGPDRNAQKADFQYPASVCIVRGPAHTRRYYPVLPPL